MGDLTDSSKFSQADIRAHSELSPDKLTSAAALSGFAKSEKDKNNLAEVIKQGTVAQVRAIGAGLSRAKDISPDILTVTQQVTKTAPTEIAYQTSIVNDPASSASDKEQAKQKIDAVQKMLLGIANNKNLIDKIDGTTMQSMLDNGNSDVMKAILNKLAERDKE